MTVPMWAQNWEVTESLLPGGQGKTYVVRDRNGKQPVSVLKVLRKQKDPEARARMFQEVNSLRILTTKNARVPFVYETNVENFQDPTQALYFVMERIEGATLDEYMKKSGPMDLKSALAFSNAICGTLKIAHDSNIYHRDLKPANIMVRGNDPADCVLLDYGLSFNVEDPFELTRKSEGMRNEFMALPELTILHGDRRDPRSDVTLACGILYYCLTAQYPSQLLDGFNRLPHRRPDRELKAENYSPGQLAALNTLFDRGFSQSIADRFQTIEDFIERTALLQASEQSPRREDTPSLAKTFTKELRGRSATVRAFAMRPLVSNVVNHLRSHIGEHYSDLGDFTIRQYSLNGPFPVEGLIPLADGIFGFGVNVKGQNRYYDFALLFHYDGSHGVAARTDLVLASQVAIQNHESVRNPKKLVWFSNTDPKKEELLPLFEEFDMLIQEGIRKLHQELMSSEK